MSGLSSVLLSLLLSVVMLVLLLRYARLHAFFSLLAASMLFGLLTGRALISTFEVMQSGFGVLLQQIGLLVAVGSCLGIVLEKTGSMVVISTKILQWSGLGRAPLAMTIVGVVVGIPVFCDSGFIILSRLVPGIATQAGVNPAQLSLSLSSGLYTTHVLVPPTPGPLAAAANFHMTEFIGTLIIISLAITIPVAIVSYFFSARFSRNIIVDKIESIYQTPSHRIAWKAFLPLLLPIVLIASASLPRIFSSLQPLAPFLQTAGQPVIALLIGLVLSFTLIQKKDASEFPGWIATALKDAGIILLITGAGGAFGAVIKASSFDQHLNNYITDTQSQGIIFLVAGFILAALLKTAQGSSTSAIIITSSLLAPLAAQAGFHTPVQLSILISAIGGGAMTVSHFNDSYFWVVSQFSGLSPAQALRSFTLLTLLQGITVLISTFILFLLL
jgi:gluconate:H+ symporter, GntP family